MLKDGITGSVILLLLLLPVTTLPANAHDPTEGLNLLLNGDFEQWETRTDTYLSQSSSGQFTQSDIVVIPRYWSAELVFSCCVFPELGNVVFQGDANTGSFGLRLGGFSGLPEQTGIYFFQEVSVVPGLPYLATYHVKNPFPGDPNARRMRGSWFDVNGALIGGAFFLPAPSSSGYTHVQGGTIFAPCNAAKIRVYIDKADFGGIEYDDVYFGQKLGVQPNSCPINIDIKPGSYPNSINTKSKGVIAVAVLSTSSFDAPSLLSPSTFVFEDAPATRNSVEDINGDGLNDLVLFFNTQQTTVVCGQTSAQLAGMRIDGGIVSGTDSIRTVGC